MRTPPSSTSTEMSAGSWNLLARPYRLASSHCPSSNGPPQPRSLAVGACQKFGATTPDSSSRPPALVSPQRYELKPLKMRENSTWKPGPCTPMLSVPSTTVGVGAATRAAGAPTVSTCSPHATSWPAGAHDVSARRCSETTIAYSPAAAGRGCGSRYDADSPGATSVSTTALLTTRPSRATETCVSYAAEEVNSIRLVRVK